MFIQNCWYLAAWSHEIGSDQMLARTIIGRPVVFWRDVDGIVAFEDRCPHRAAPLSKGIREGDGVRCRYHGLLFDRNGRCVEAPAQSPPAVMKLQRFRVAERARWIWIWMGDPDLANEDDIPATPCMDHPDWRCLPGYLHYDVNYLLIADNLLDFSHLPYLHTSTIGGSPDFATVRPSIERLPRGVRIKRWVPQTEVPAYNRHRFPDTKVDRWIDYDFLAPGVLLMDSGMCEAGSGNHLGDRCGAIETRGYQAITPETETSTHYFFTIAHNYEIDKPAIAQQLLDALKVAFDEDRDMISAQQRNLELVPDARMYLLGVDSALVMFRRVIDSLLEAEKPSVKNNIIPISNSTTSEAT